MSETEEMVMLCNLTALCQAATVEVEGMRWTNEGRIQNGLTPTYGEEAFFLKAEEIAGYARKMVELLNKQEPL
jgi:hypothetical protein